MTPFQTSLAILALVGLTIFCIQQLVSGVKRVGEMSLPECYGSNPEPQELAENGCSDCPFMNACLVGTPWLEANPLLDELEWKPLDGPYTYRPTAKLPEIS